MFSIGESIAYPMHGAGMVLDIEEREVLGEKHQYYHVNLPHSRMTVMIPVDNSEAVGVRRIIGKEEIPKVLEVLEGPTESMPSNWNRRYRENTERLRTGDILTVAAVVRNLVRSDRKKKLSTGEKKLLGSAKQILESELMLAAGISQEEADRMVEAHI